MPDRRQVVLTLPLKPGPHWVVQTAPTAPGLQVVGQPKVKSGLGGRLVLAHTAAEEQTRSQPYILWVARFGRNAKARPKVVSMTQY